MYPSFFYKPGYGTAFVKFLINEIINRGEDKVILEVAKDNFAKRLYESLGFKLEIP
ncbi:GNAT family N-acetyltransferase [Paenibacillus selenitireducens]|uniref:GNAT family N-acetyltransferase n=1 Tax=Paenibacillus selenitireducens TaxID=1324314 RepID=UPI001301BC57